MTEYPSIVMEAMTKSSASPAGRPPRPGSGLLLAVAGSLLVTTALRLPLLRDIENRTYDVRVRWHTPREPARLPITIVAVDDESLTRLEPAVGRWPWPRALFATVVDYASAAPVIGLDILFPESDPGFTRSDDLLAEQAAHHGRVLSATFYDAQTRAWVEPYPALRDAVAGLGHVHVEPEADGVARRHRVRKITPAGVRVSLAAQVAARYAGTNPPPARWPDEFLLCPLAQPPAVVSIADLMSAWGEEQQGRVPTLDRAAFSNRIVLVGSLATGLPQDREVTPVKESEAGVLITATAVDNLLTGRFYRHLAGPWTAILTLLLGLLPFSVRSSRPTTFFALNTLFPFAYAGASLLAVEAGRFMLPLVGPLLAWLLNATGLLARHWQQERARRLDLQALEQSKQYFTDMLVHDLRNRVAAARASLQVLNRPAASGPASPLLGVAEASLQSMLAEVNSLLDIRRMEEGRLRLNAEPADLAGLLEEVSRDYAAAAALTRATLVHRVEAGTPITIPGDRPLLVRLLGNLVTNALQHGKAGQPVRLEASPAGHQVRLTVANQGPVMSAEAQQWLFQPFARLKDGRRAPGRGQGTGLGLTLARLAAEAHGGRLEVESPWQETGDGVAIHVYLPHQQGNLS